MDREIRLEIDDWCFTEALFTWNGQNNTENVGYKMKKKSKRKKTPRRTGCCLLLWHFYREIKSDLRVKEIMITTKTTITIIIYCFGVENETKSDIGFSMLLHR